MGTNALEQVHIVVRILNLKYVFKIPRHCFYQLSKLKNINKQRQKTKCLKKYTKDLLFYEFSDTSGVQKILIICFVVAQSSQFLGENKENLIF